MVARLIFNPQEQPFVIANQSLHAIADDVLQGHVLRYLLSMDNQWQQDKVLLNDHPKDNPVARPAAVLVPIVQSSEGLQLLLTKRSSHLRNHPGQISFPGGRIDVQDPSLMYTAIRETKEEVGIDDSFIEVIAEQPAFYTNSGFNVKPYIAFLRPGYQIKLQENEVEQLFYVPLNFLMNPDHHHLHTAVLDDKVVRYFYSMPWNNYFIWGVTAAIIRNIYQRLYQSLPAL